MTDVYCSEVPNLLQTHFDHLLKSAISPDVMRERGYISVLGKTKLKELHFNNAQQRRTPAILIPLYGPDGSPAGYQIRPDHPRLDKGKNTPIKYESVPDQPVRLDMPARCRQYARDPSIPLYITEGAKKADALATAGAAAINLTGVWGFLGRNEFGATTFLADFDYLAWQKRIVYIVYDSDIVTKPQVHKALERLAEHLVRKGADVRIVRLPADKGQKVGADDFLDAGHTLSELTDLAQKDIPEQVEQPPLALHSPVYCIHEGHYCVIKNIEGHKMMVPLCNFTAHIKEQIIEDNGAEESTKFVIDGTLDNMPLATAEVPASKFNSLNFVTEKWGAAAVIYAGSSTKDHLRTIIQLSSANNINTQRVYTHTGWRKIKGERYFLTASGALGRPDILVSLKEPLNRYQLPQDETVSPIDAMKASLEFLDFGKFENQATLWAAMYLSPLCELLNPAFTIWIVGHTGSFKSALSALALCHFGTFDYATLPRGWDSTANSLQHDMFTLKDLPLVIDDWRPPSSLSEAKQLEDKADRIVRAMGNKSGRGRLTAEAKARETYVPRGLVISTAEQLPGGESHASRLFVLECDRSDVNVPDLKRNQKLAWQYKYAMAHYIKWLATEWETVKKSLPESWEHWRDKLVAENPSHMRLPAAVAWLYAGMEMAMTYAVSIRVLSVSEAQEIHDRAWEAFSHLATAQGARVQQERPAMRFLDAFKTLLEQKRILVKGRLIPDLEPIKQGQLFVGWEDSDYYYILPKAAYGAVFDFCHRGGEPLLFKAAAVWDDLLRLGYLRVKCDKYYAVVRIGQMDESVTKRVIQLDKNKINVKEAVE